MKGKYVVVEGIEGSGKTTMIQVIFKIFLKNGIKKIHCTREPGGTPLAEKMRQLIKHGVDEENIFNKAELFMLYAARIQLIEGIVKPFLSKGEWVISDRHDLSTQAYQGGGRNFSIKFLKKLRKIALGNFSPDLTLYLDVDPRVGFNRICNNRIQLDRIEMESLDFFNKVRFRYLDLANQNDSIIVVDANQSLKKVQNDICKILLNWLKNV